MTTQNSKLSLSIPNSGKPRIVILGCGFGGINVAQKLKNKGFQIILLDRFNYHTFQPLLYQVATAGLEPDTISGPYRKIFNIKEDTHFRMVKVLGIDPVEKKIRTLVGDLSYDYAVIATGSKMNYFGNEDIKVNALPLKHVPHALDLRSQIFQNLEKASLVSDENELRKLLTFVIAGGGPTGMELAGALAEMRKHVLPKDYPNLDLSKMKIYIVEALPRLLPMMSEKAGQRAAKYLKNLGVNIVTDALTQGYDGTTVKLKGKDDIQTYTLIWAAGVKGNIPGEAKNMAVTKGKILVNEFNQVKIAGQEGGIFPETFAIGDVALMKKPNHPKGYPGLAQVAIQQGKNTAKNTRLMIYKKPLKEFHYKNKGTLATIGRSKAVADLPGNIKLGGFLAWFIWLMVHLVSLVGFRNKLIVLTNWLYNYINYDKGIRLIIRPKIQDKNDKVMKVMEHETKEK